MYITAIVVVGDKKLLYHGLMEDLFFNKTGNLDRIMLRDVSRRYLEHDRPDKKIDPKDDKTFYPIDGDHFIINHSDILTLNVDYRYVFPQDDGGEIENKDSKISNEKRRRNLRRKEILRRKQLSQYNYSIKENKINH